MLTKHAIFLAITAAFLAGCEDGPARVQPKDLAVSVEPSAETTVMPDADDAADDPAIWVHPSALEQSLIIGTNKQRGLVVYRLDGSEASKRDDGRMNNVDLRQGVKIGDFTGDLVAATNRDKKSIDLYSLDGAAATLSPLLSIPTGFADPYGLCLYWSAKTADIYVIANNSGDGLVGQWRMTANGTTLAAEQVRSFNVGSQAEGCAADDENGVLFIAEEDVGLYAYWAEPDAAAEHKNARIVIDSTSGTGHLTADAEGIAVLKTADGSGYVIVSSQGSNSFNVYDRAAPHAFRGAFQIGPTSEQVGIDGVEETDGIDITGTPLGGAFVEGLFVAQDGFNYEGTGKMKRVNQNFKLVPWRSIREGLALPAPVTSVPANAESPATHN